MNRILRYSLLSMLIMVCGLVSAETENIDFTKLSITETSDGFTLTSEPFTFEAVKNSSSTKPTQNGTSKDIRIYAKGTITVSAPVKMTKMVFSISAQGLKRWPDVTPSVGTVTNDIDAKTLTWTVEEGVDNVSFTVGDKATYGTEGSDKAGQFDFNAVAIDYEQGEGPVKANPGLVFSETNVTAVLGVEFTEPTLTKDTPADAVYSSSNEAVATVDAQTGAVTLVSDGTTIITATVAETDEYRAGSASYTLVVDDGVDLTNTPETAYTVARLNELIAEGKGLDAKMYVKGKISAITEISTSYGNATYYISDDGTDEGQFQIYRGYSLNGEKFTSEDEIKVGDEVIVYGNITDYKGTYQMATGSSIYSLNGGSGEVVDISNTPETAYTVTEANELITAGKGLATSVYVKGKISAVTEISTSYGNATYTIYDNDTDKATDELVTLVIFRGYSLEGNKFTSEDEIKVGDEVIVYGKLVNYNGTYEMTTGSSIYSLNGRTTSGISTVKADAQVDGVVYNMAGQRLAKPAKGINIIGGRKVIVK